ncbi:MAG: class I SAM-dependent methyltransferase [Mycoplasma sp.]
MKRINKIVDLINNATNVIDVGSDHAYLSIKLLQSKKAKFVVNIEANKGPHNQGVKNLIKYNLLDKTQNIVNNGLKSLEKKLDISFDFCVVAGLGSNVIIDIISNNKLKVNTFILQTNKNEFLLRQWLVKNKFKIINEYYVLENKIYYPIFVIQKSNLKRFSSYSNLLLGSWNKIKDKALYLDYLKQQKEYIEQIENNNIKTKKHNELKHLSRRISKYENKRFV